MTVANWSQTADTNSNKSGDFGMLRLIIDHAELDFIGYEFEVKEEIFIEEYGDTQWLFRMDISKETNEISVYCAYSEDYDIMEDATGCFDTAKLLIDIKNWLLENEVSNHGEYFLAYAEAQDEHGIDSEEALIHAYNSEKI